MRKPFIAGNWKMNTNAEEAVELASGLLPVAKENSNVEVVIAPPFVHFAAIAKVIKESRVRLSAQNMFWEDRGAYTGEISPVMLSEYGCSHVIIGHSERRMYMHETDEMINKKLHTALRHALLPILCIGETLHQRKENKTWEVMQSQIEHDFKDVAEEYFELITVAYEPIWAIGTGIAAQTSDAVEVHEKIRKHFTTTVGKELANKIRIIYGGSVTSANIEGFMKEESIDGALVGGASLKLNEFSAIIQHAQQAKR